MTMRVRTISCTISSLPLSAQSSYLTPSGPWFHCGWRSSVGGSNAVSAHLCLPSETNLSDSRSLNPWVSKSVRIGTKRPQEFSQINAIYTKSNTWMSWSWIMSNLQFCKNSSLTFNMKNEIGLISCFVQLHLFSTYHERKPVEKIIEGF